MIDYPSHLYAINKAKKMRKSILITALVASFFSIGMANPIEAKTVDGFSFRDLEYDYGASDANRIGNAEVAKLIPQGMPIEEAVATMRDAGARCKIQTKGMQCRYTGFEAVEEALHDLIWTVDLTVSDGRVAQVRSSRESVGS